jgi:hypothetical protein
MRHLVNSLVVKRLRPLTLRPLLFKRSIVERVFVRASSSQNPSTLSENQHSKLRERISRSKRSDKSDKDKGDDFAIFFVLSGYLILISLYMTYSSGRDRDRRNRPLQHKPLKQDEIRLLVLEPGNADDQIRCRLKHASLASNPKFEALSYVWGDQNVTAEVEFSQERFTVTANLYKALKHLRYAKSERVIWADAICIDQKSPRERSEQALLISRIYSQAKYVLIWLGEEDTWISEPAFHALKSLNSFFERRIAGYSGDLTTYSRGLGLRKGGRLQRTQTLSRREFAAIEDLDWISIRKLLLAPWFYHLWTLQEAVKAKNAVVMCGNQTIPFDILAKVTLEVRLHGYIPGMSLQAVSSLSSTATLRAAAGAPLLDLVRFTSSRLCMDARDRIFALLGLATDVSAEDRDFVYPNYSLSVEEVYQRFARWCILEKRDLDILSCAQNYEAPSNLALPSWVPDWSRHSHSHDIWKFQKFRASGSSLPCVSVSSDNKNLTIKGLVVDKIQQLALSYYQFSLMRDINKLPDLTWSGGVAQVSLMEHKVPITRAKVLNHKSSIP